MHPRQTLSFRDAVAECPAKAATRGARSCQPRRPSGPMRTNRPIRRALMLPKSVVLSAINVIKMIGDAR